MVGQGPDQCTTTRRYSFRSRVGERQPVWPSSRHQESRFFKSILRREVALGMKRTRYQLAPAVPMQEVVDRAVAGRMPDRFLVARLEIMDVQHLAGAGCFGKRGQMVSGSAAVVLSGVS